MVGEKEKTVTTGGSAGDETHIGRLYVYRNPGRAHIIIVRSTYMYTYIPVSIYRLCTTYHLKEFHEFKCITLQSDIMHIQNRQIGRYCVNVHKGEIVQRSTPPHK